VTVTLVRFLGSCGLGDQRRCEGLVRSGRVTVGGAEVTEPSTTIEPVTVVVRVDGEEARPEPTSYYVLHKPAGYVCDVAQEAGRPSVLDLMGRRGNVQTADGLGEEDEGLLVMTNDDTVSKLLKDPACGVPKTYRVTVIGELTWKELRRLRDGVDSGQESARVSAAKLLRCARTNSKADVTTTTSSAGVVRSMFRAVGYRVTKLRRVRIGLVELGRLPQGSWRRVTTTELEYLVKLRFYRSHRGAAEHMTPNGAHDHAVGHRH